MSDSKLYTVGITKDFRFVCINMPPDELTPTGATILLTVDEARGLADVLNIAAYQVKTQNPGAIMPAGYAPATEN